MVNKKWCTLRSYPLEPAKSLWSQLVVFDSVAFDEHVMAWAMDCQSHKAATLPGASLSEECGEIQDNKC